MPKIYTADSMCLSLSVFKHARSQPAKPARKQNLHEIVSQGHFRSSIVGSLQSRQRTKYRHIVTLASSLKYQKKIASESAENCRSRQPHCRLMPLPGEPTRIFAQILHLSIVGLSSLKFLWWPPRDASLLQHSAYRPFKVIQGRWFWHQSKGRMRLPISH